MSAGAEHTRVAVGKTRAAVTYYCQSFNGWYVWSYALPHTVAWCKDPYTIINGSDAPLVVAADSSDACILSRTE